MLSSGGDVPVPVALKIHNPPNAIPPPEERRRSSPAPKEPTPPAPKENDRNSPGGFPIASSDLDLRKKVPGLGEDFLDLLPPIEPHPKVDNRPEDGLPPHPIEVKAFKPLGPNMEDPVEPSMDPFEPKMESSPHEQAKFDDFLEPEPPTHSKHEDSLEPKPESPAPPPPQVQPKFDDSFLEPEPEVHRESKPAPNLMLDLGPPFDAENSQSHDKKFSPGLNPNALPFVPMNNLTPTSPTADGAGASDGALPNGQQEIPTQNQDEKENGGSKSPPPAPPSLEQLQKEWGEPLGLPMAPPPGDKKPAPPSGGSAAKKAPPPAASAGTAARLSAPAKTKPAPPRAAPAATSGAGSKPNASASGRSTAIGAGAALKTAVAPVSASALKGAPAATGTKSAATSKTTAPPAKAPTAAAKKAPSSVGAGAAAKKPASVGLAQPMYFDLVYLPHHGDPGHADVEFFKVFFFSISF